MFPLWSSWLECLDFYGQNHCRQKWQSAGGGEGHTSYCVVQNVCGHWDTTPSQNLAKSASYQSTNIFATINHQFDRRFDGRLDVSLHCQDQTPHRPANFPPGDPNQKWPEIVPSPFPLDLAINVRPLYHSSNRLASGPKIPKSFGNTVV